MMTTVRKSLTGIGSLPHHNIDAALEFSFQMGIPFLPQIPIRNPWEYMIAQALEQLPGLQAEEDGQVVLNLDIWNSRAHALNQRLSKAYDNPSSKDAFEEFEPSPATSSSWQPFLWECQERGAKLVKIQIAGPMTCQWAIKMKDGTSIDQAPELGVQIFRLVLARALAMTRKLQSAGIQPILYLDEPGLYGLTLANPKHVMGLQELKLMVQTLRKEKVLVGLHCCSNTDWNSVLSLGLNYLSIDTGLSLDSLLTTGDSLLQYIQQGGKLSLGVIPTSRSSFGLHSIQTESLFEHLMNSFAKAWGSRPELVKKVLAEAIYTPACGLALHSVEDSAFVLDALTELHDFTLGNITQH